MKSCISGVSLSRSVFLCKVLRAPALMWTPSSQLYAVVVCCSMAAAVQGMDESVTNGANLFWAPQGVVDLELVAFFFPDY